MAEVCSSEAVTIDKPIGNGMKRGVFERAMDVAKRTGEIKYGDYKADIVLTNVIGITLMHVFAAYGVTRILEMKAYTLAWTFFVLHCNSMVSIYRFNCVKEVLF